MFYEREQVLFTKVSRKKILFSSCYLLLFLSFGSTFFWYVPGVLYHIIIITKKGICC
jgi:hypothetical protein